MTATTQHLSADIGGFSFRPYLKLNEARGMASGSEIYIDAILFDRVSRVRDETLAGQLRENLTRALHPSLAAGRLRFDGHPLHVCLHMTNDQISGIGNPPVPAIGTMSYLSENEYDEKPSLLVTVYAKSSCFETFRRTLVESELIKAHVRELSITVNKDLEEWDKSEPLFVVEFAVLVSSRNGAA